MIYDIRQTTTYHYASSVAYAPRRSNGAKGTISSATG